MTEPLEVEVKLRVDRPRLAAALIRRGDPARLAGFEPEGPPTLVVVTDRYVDAADGPSIVASGIRARLRRRGTSTEVTVKRPGELLDGITTRVELKGPATASLHPDRWPPSAARDVLRDAIGGRGLVEIARLRQHRLTTILRRGGTRIEVSLDALAAIAGGRIVARRHELEAELVEGDRADLVDLASALWTIDGVGAPLGSKLQFALDAAATGVKSRAER